MRLRNLVFEGGGIKGIAFARVPEVLEEFGLLEGIEAVAGTSAGSIVAMLIALRYKPASINKALMTMKFNNFQDSRLYSQKTYSLVVKSGIHNGELFAKWIKSLIFYKTGEENTTFAELFSLTGIELVITATSLTAKKILFLSHKTYPDMPVYLAMRATIAIPGFFVPVKYDGHTLVDGGLLNNYPVWIFDNKDTYEFKYKNILSATEETLGFKLVRPDDKPANTIRLPICVPPIIKTLYSLLETMTYFIDENYKVEGYWNRTVGIDTLGICSTDFDLDEDIVSKLINAGYEATRTTIINKIESEKEILMLAKTL